MPAASINSNRVAASMLSSGHGFLSVLTAVTGAGIIGVIAWGALHANPVTDVTEPSGRAVASTPPDQLVAIEPADLWGDPGAPAVAMVFVDLASPYDAIFILHTLPALLDNLRSSKTLLTAFRQFPTTEWAAAAATHLMCAGRTGSYFDAQLSFSRRQLAGLDGVGISLASPIGSNQAGRTAEEPTGCEFGLGRDRVKADVELGRALRIAATPLFLFGRREGADQMRPSRRISGLITAGQFIAEANRAIGEADLAIPRLPASPK